MPRIPIWKVVPGQTLARPVTNGSGLVMMPAGTDLTPALIERLANLGVDTIVVLGDEAAVRRSPDAIQRGLDELFAGHEQDAWMMDLKGIILRQASRGGGDV
jgi:hypothetical protein